MTFFNYSKSIKNETVECNYNVLKPPLKLKEVINDWKVQWCSLYQSKLKYFKKLTFMILYTFQRFAYNLGWLVAINDYRKSRN